MAAQRALVLIDYSYRQAGIISLTTATENKGEEQREADGHEQEEEGCTPVGDQLAKIFQGDVNQTHVEAPRCSGASGVSLAESQDADDKEDGSRGEHDGDGEQQIPEAATLKKNSPATHAPTLGNNKRNGFKCPRSSRRGAGEYGEHADHAHHGHHAAIDDATLPGIPKE